MISENKFGNIEFVRSERAKYIRVRILANGLKISLPMSATHDEAMRFINSEHKSILTKQEKIQQKEKNNPTILNEDSKFKTLTFEVELKRVSRKNIFFSLKNGLLLIEFPENTDCLSKETQQNYWNGINYFLRKEAKRLLPDRTKQLATTYGFTYSTVKIQSSKSRWGSCSRDRNINLSFFLLLLPAYLIDYVILHELCHTKELNHSDKFWQLMDKVTANKSRNLRAEVKKYSMPV